MPRKTAPTTAALRRAPRIELIRCDEIQPDPFQPRKHIDPVALRELADSILERGLLQAIRVFERGTERAPYIIETGERRWRACFELLHHDRIKAEIVPVKEPAEALADQIVENDQREALTYLEEAHAYADLQARGTGGHLLTVDQVAEQIGKKPAHVAQRLRLNALIPEARKELETGQIYLGHALQIARLQPPEQKEALKHAKRQEWTSQGTVSVPASVRVLELWIQDEVLMELKRAPWKLEDPELVPAAGACTTCPKRTGSQPALWADLKGPDRCSDRGCFKSKAQAFLQVRVAAITKRDGRAPLMLSDMYYNAPKNLVSHQDWKEAARKGRNGCKLSRPAIVVGELVPKEIFACADKACRRHFTRPRTEPRPDPKKAAAAKAKARVDNAATWVLERELIAHAPTIAAMTAADWQLLVPVLTESYNREDMSAGELAGFGLRAPAVLTVDQFSRLLGAALVCEAQFRRTGDLRELAKRWKVDPKRCAKDAARMLEGRRARIEAIDDGRQAAGKGYKPPKDACAHCGCTEGNPCPGGCGWMANPNKKPGRLCTACHEEGARL